jgi:hypothetical protein
MLSCLTVQDPLQVGGGHVDGDTPGLHRVIARVGQLLGVVRLTAAHRLCAHSSQQIPSEVLNASHRGSPATVCGASMDPVEVRIRELAAGGAGVDLDTVFPKGPVLPPEGLGRTSWAIVRRPAEKKAQEPHPNDLHQGRAVRRSPSI